MLTFFHWSYIQHLMLSEMNVANIYVNPVVYLLNMIYFRRCRENSQHYLSANPYLNHISMENYKQ